MGPATLGAKAEPSSVRLRLLAADGVNEPADPQATAVTGLTPVETGLCTTPASILGAIAVVQKPLNHRDKPGGEEGIAALSAEAVGLQLQTARTSQAAWAAVPLTSRLKILKKLRLLIAADPRTLANTVGRDNLAETLAAEVLPLLDACRFLETESGRLLREKTVGSRASDVALGKLRCSAAGTSRCCVDHRTVKLSADVAWDSIAAGDRRGECRCGQAGIEWFASHTDAGFDGGLRRFARRIDAGVAVLSGSGHGGDSHRCGESVSNGLSTDGQGGEP